MSIVITPATLRDYAFVTKAFAVCNEDHRLARPDLYRDVPVSATRLEFNAVVLMHRLGLQPYAIRIARVDGVEAGVTFIQSKKRSKLSWSRFEKEAYLDNLAVMPGMRGQGVGTALLRDAVEWSKQTGHAHIYAQIVSTNHASLDLFESEGFSNDKRIVGRHLKA